MAHASALAGKYMAPCFVLTGTNVDYNNFIGTLTHFPTHINWRIRCGAFNSLLTRFYDGCTCVFCESQRQFTSSTTSLRQGQYHWPE
ncbi:uncharacterized protein V1513DRAFT_448990 [Lipomyces chichibuensis]|uniref:uncharacterized protein n=1 Tax=Lipomyces chichibuensis TaxID=1546026 RepID=UPI003343EB4C